MNGIPDHELVRWRRFVKANEDILATILRWRYYFYRRQNKNSKAYKMTEAWLNLDRWRKLLRECVKLGVNPFHYVRESFSGYEFAIWPHVLFSKKSYDRYIQGGAMPNWRHELDMHRMYSKDFGSYGVLDVWQREGKYTPGSGIDPSLIEERPALFRWCLLMREQQFEDADELQNSALEKAGNAAAFSAYSTDCPSEMAMLGASRRWMQ